MVTARPLGLLKSSPASFIVQEVTPSGSIVPLYRESSIRGRESDDPYTLFHMTKRGATTPDAQREIAKQLEVPLSATTRYGLKDRHAHTAQCIAVQGDFRPRFWHPQIMLVQQHGLSRPLQHGANAGNRFRINVVTDATTLDAAVFRTVRNRFGHQRFGTHQGSEAGRLVLEGDYDQAGRILGAPGVRKLRRIRDRVTSWREAFLHRDFAFDLEMLVLQWQSHLWNTLLESMSDPLPHRLPMWAPEQRERYLDLWAPGPLDKQAAARLHGFNRPTIVNPKNIKVTPAYGSWDVEFELPSGAYATVVLEQAFELREERRAQYA